MSSPFYRPEPKIGDKPNTQPGVLLCNLGSPSSTSRRDVRRFLRQFLDDPRVVEMPRWKWGPLLHGVILRFRPASSAKRYRSIWMPDGSPLMVWSSRQAMLLSQALDKRGFAAPVHMAMRYGQPSIEQGLDALKTLGCTRILMLPMYPQYSGSTTGSAMDALALWSLYTRRVPEIRTIGDFHLNPGYINALAHRVEQTWASTGPPDKLVMSFHGLPQSMIEQGDPYEQQCQTTAQMLANKLGLASRSWCISFQSRFGSARWLQPSTAQILEDLGSANTRRVDVVCPGFVADCLETLEEIAIEGQAIFVKAGGGTFRFIESLNDDPVWIAALAELVVRHLKSWPVFEVISNASTP